MPLSFRKNKTRVQGENTGKQGQIVYRPGGLAARDLTGICRTPLHNNAKQTYGFFFAAW
jgi:hypothetical protein